MSACPKCGKDIVLATIENPRNGKWTVLPLEYSPDIDEIGEFDLTREVHEAVNIMGEVVGMFPVVEHKKPSGWCLYRTHSPSHFLES